MLYTIEELPPIDFEPPLKKLKNTKVSDSKFKKSHKKKKKNNRLSKNNDEPKIVDDSSNDKSSAEVTEFNSAAWSSLGVPAPILKALEDNKFTTPTVIQSLTLGPAILGHRDILGAAETGSGKTLAFGIPILAGILKLKEEKPEVEDDEQESDSTKEINRCGTADSWLVSTEGNNSAAEFSGSEQESEEELDDDLVNTDGIGCVKVIDYGLVDDCTTASTSVVTKPLYALILTPTRELAIQIRDHLCKAAKYTDIKIAVVIGGMAAVKQERILSKGPEIVIATPGRLWELIDQGNIHLSQLHSIKYLAIDETDRMLEKGHFQELHQILERINSISESLDKRQTFVFSATLTLVHDIPDFLMRKKKQRPSSKIFKITPGQKLQKVIDLLKIKNPKVVDITKERGKLV